MRKALGCPQNSNASFQPSFKLRPDETKFEIRSLKYLRMKRIMLAPRWSHAAAIAAVRSTISDSLRREMNFPEISKTKLRKSKETVRKASCGNFGRNWTSWNTHFRTCNTHARACNAHNRPRRVFRSKPYSFVSKLFRMIFRVSRGRVSFRVSRVEISSSKFCNLLGGRRHGHSTCASTRVVCRDSSISSSAAGLRWNGPSRRP